MTFCVCVCVCLCVCVCVMERRQPDTVSPLASSIRMNEIAQGGIMFHFNVTIEGKFGFTRARIQQSNNISMIIVDDSHYECLILYNCKLKNL